MDAYIIYSTHQAVKCLNEKGLWNVVQEVKVGEWVQPSEDHLQLCSSFCLAMRQSDPDKYLPPSSKADAVNNKWETKPDMSAACKFI